MPMRYIAVCEKGSHAQDVNWFKWAHRGRAASLNEAVRFCRDYKSLRFHKLATRGEGLAALVVKCYGCGNERRLAELVTKGALHRDGIRCAGRQPWEPEDSGKKPCPYELVAVQRGATGNYIAERISALDIPEERPQSAEAADKIRGHVFFEKVVTDNGGPLSEQVAQWIADDLGVTPETVLAVAAGRRPRRTRCCSTSRTVSGRLSSRNWMVGATAREATSSSTREASKVSQDRRACSARSAVSGRCAGSVRSVLCEDSGVMMWKRR